MTDGTDNFAEESVRWYFPFKNYLYWGMSRRNICPRLKWNIHVLMARLDICPGLDNSDAKNHTKLLQSYEYVPYYGMG